MSQTEQEELVQREGETDGEFAARKEAAAEAAPAQEAEPTEAV